jgi:hypothetical protein
METLQTVVDVLKRESADAADLSSLEARMGRLQAEAEEQAVQLQAARLTINTEAARNEELRQQISLLGKQRDCIKESVSVAEVRDVFPGSECFHPGSRGQKENRIPDADPQPRI